ncbi:MAG: cation-translocating P-type ATPase C-terminal domain-containing protein [Candidatus Accumulibacter phosphatis]|nr:cation-translocating P-type ATPase C-terminal domain-containing protein [Candidatus Accumulibacter phosphatis]
MNSEFAPGILIGTLSMFPHGLAAHDPQYALTLAFTALVLFQFFNVFQRLQRACGKTQRLQRLMLCQRQAVAGARRHARAAGAGGAWWGAAQPITDIDTSRHRLFSNAHKGSHERPRKSC